MSMLQERGEGQTMSMLMNPAHGVDQGISISTTLAVGAVDRAIVKVIISITQQGYQ